jgi:sugar phosphate isomerase/epimerase
MFKIGCCLSMNAKTDSKTGEEAIPLFAKMGFDYIELPLAQVMDLSEEEFNELLRQIRTGGIPMEACNNFFPARLRLTGEDAKPDLIMEYVKAATERAATMGAKIIVLGSSGAKNIPPGFPYESALIQLKELLIRIDEIMAPLEITVALEPLNKKESNFITTASEGLELVQDLSLDNIKLLIDYYHLRMEDEDFAVINEAGPDLRHLHIASKEGRLFPKPGDNENYGLFFARLKAIGYEGRVSVEAKSQDLAADGAAALKLLRSLIY